MNELSRRQLLGGLVALPLFAGFNPFHKKTLFDVICKQMKLLPDDAGIAQIHIIHDSYWYGDEFKGLYTVQFNQYFPSVLEKNQTTVKGKYGFTHRYQNLCHDIRTPRHVRLSTFHTRVFSLDDAFKTMMELHTAYPTVGLNVNIRDIELIGHVPYHYNGKPDRHFPLNGIYAIRHRIKKGQMYPWNEFSLSEVI